MMFCSIKPPNYMFIVVNAFLICKLK